MDDLESQVRQLREAIEKSDLDHLTKIEPECLNHLTDALFNVGRTFDEAVMWRRYIDDIAYANDIAVGQRWRRLIRIINAPNSGQPPLPKRQPQDHTLRLFEVLPLLIPHRGRERYYEPAFNDLLAERIEGLACSNGGLRTWRVKTRFLVGMLLLFPGCWWACSRDLITKKLPEWIRR